MNDAERREALESARAAFGAHVQARREALGWRRPDLAAAMGYRSLDKGAARVASWETGRDVPRAEQVGWLRGALGPDDGAFETLLAEAQRAETIGERARARACRAWNDAVGGELRLLATQLELLMAHRQPILERPDWRDIHVHGAGCSIAYLGGQHFQLGGLLSLWSADLFSAPCGDCGGRTYLVFAGGSPLSGRHRAHGFCATNRELRALSLPPGHGFGGMAVRAVQHVRALPPPAVSGWSLAQLVAELGGPVEDVTLFDEHGEPFATWDHGRAALRYRSGSTVEVSLDATPENATRQDLRGAPRSGGRLVLGSIAPLRLGAWRGSELVLDDGRGRPVTARASGLEGSNGDTLASFSGVLPPAVLAHLVAQDGLGPSGSAPVDDRLSPSTRRS